MNDSLLNGIVGLTSMAMIAGVLFSPIIRRSKLWTVTVTPLASIIGSGFLISAPVLYDTFGSLAVPALILINLLAIGLGLAIRHNMLHFDPNRAAMMHRYRSLGILGRLASLVLSLAYLISVAFYVALLTAFALQAVGFHTDLLVKVSSTVVLLLIGGVGYWRGLHGLEALEKVAVNSKMAIIGGLLLVLVIFRLRGSPGYDHVLSSHPLGLHELRALGGLLIITQGFETTKYMGSEYAVRPRVRALLLSQLIALGVYVAFVGLVGPLVSNVDAKDETAIIALVAKLSGALGIALSLGAVFSQFSAAVADTVGAGGIVKQEIKSDRFPAKTTYPLIALAAIAVVWAFDVFVVMAFASRAFAAYYGIQCVIATLTTVRRPQSPLRTAKLIGFPALGACAFLIAAFAIAAE